MCELALRLVEHALRLDELLVALALDVDELRVLVGLATLDLTVVFLKLSDAFLGRVDRRILRRKHAALDMRGPRCAAKLAEHLVERLGILFDLDAELFDRAAALPA